VIILITSFQLRLDATDFSKKIPRTSWSEINTGIQIHSSEFPRELSVM